MGSSFGKGVLDVLLWRKEFCDLYNLVFPLWVKHDTLMAENAIYKDKADALKDKVDTLKDEIIETHKHYNKLKLHN